MSSQTHRTWLAFGALAALGVVASLPLLFGSDHRSRLLALNSFLLAAGTCAVALPWGTALAALLVRTDVHARKLAMVVVAAMLFVPLYLQAAGWQAAFGLGGWYSEIGAAAAAQPILNGWWGAVWIHGVAALPWVTLIVGLGFAAVPREWEETALLDGTPRQVFRHVTLRQSWGAVAVAALWVLVTTFGEMTVADMFQLRTYAEELYTGFALGDTLGEAPLRVLPGMTVVVWLTVTAGIVCARVVPRQDWAALPRFHRYRLGRWRWPAVVFAAMTVLVIAGVPLASLVYQAGVARSGAGATTGPVWSFTHFLTIVGNSPKEHAAEFGWTLLTGTLAALGAVVLAVLLAWPARRGGSRAVPLIVVTAACLAIPGPLVGMGLVKAFSQPGIPAINFLYDKSIFAPWAAQLIRSLPLAVLIVWQALRTVPEDTIEMAQIDGAGSWTQLVRVALPQRYGAVVAAWLVACAIAMGDVAATASDMVIPAGIDLLSRNIAGMLHASVYDRIAGICLTNAAVFVFISALVVWLMSPRRRDLNR